MIKNGLPSNQYLFDFIFLASIYSLCVKPELKTKERANKRRETVRTENRINDHGEGRKKRQHKELRQLLEKRFFIKHSSSLRHTVDFQIFF